MLDGRRREAGQVVRASVRQPLSLAVLGAALALVLVLVAGSWSPADAQEVDPPTTPSTEPPATTPTTRPPATTPTTRPPATTPTTRPPVQSTLPPATQPPVDDGGGEDQSGGGDEEQAAVPEVAEVAMQTFTTNANLLVPGNGLSGAQPATTTTTTALPADGGNEAEEESRTIWMIIAALAGVGVLVALLTWRYWLLTRPGLRLDGDDEGEDELARPRGGGRRGGPVQVRGGAPVAGVDPGPRGGPAGGARAGGPRPPRGGAQPGRRPRPDDGRGPAPGRGQRPPGRQPAGPQGSRGGAPRGAARSGAPGGGATRAPRPPQRPAPDADLWGDPRRY